MGKKKVTDKDIVRLNSQLIACFPVHREKLLSKLSMFWLNGPKRPGSSKTI